MAQQKQIRLETMRLQVQSLVSLSGLRIGCCHELWCRSQTWLRYGCSPDLTPRVGTSICHRCIPKKQKNKNQKKKKRQKNPYGLSEDDQVYVIFKVLKNARVSSKLAIEGLSPNTKDYHSTHHLHHVQRFQSFTTFFS